MDNSNKSSEGTFPSLNLPPAELKFCRCDNFLKVFDKIRKKFVTLTPEEYVRQNFINYLINYLNYPPSVIANEIGIKLNGTIKRCDSVIFNSDGSPLMIVEYKSPKVEITQNVFDQIVRYNMTLHAHYLTVSNGLSHYCCAVDYVRGTYNFIPEIPDYNTIRSSSSAN